MSLELTNISSPLKPIPDTIRLKLEEDMLGMGKLSEDENE
jgi:hypothetical protein